MKQLKLSEAQVKSLTIEQVAVLATISNTPRKDYETAFYCYQDYIANKLSISTKQVQRITSDLKKSEAFNVTKERVKGSKEYRNIYQFNSLNSNFILVSDRIFEGLELEEIGTLIKLKALTLNNSLTILKPKEWIASALSIGKTRLNRILLSLETKGLLSYSKGTLTLKGDLFLDNSTFGRRNTTRKEKRDMILAMYKKLAEIEIKKGSYKGKMLIKYLPKANYPLAALKGIIRMQNKPKEEIKYTNLILF